MNENWRLDYLLGLNGEDPNDEFILFAIAQEYASKGDYPSAIKYYLELKSLNPSYIGLYFHLAKVYELIDQQDDALSTYLEGEKVAQSFNDLHALSELKNARINLELEL